ncbi:hypothetical protein AAC387_Pa08g2350 [Persea americana]
MNLLLKLQLVDSRAPKRSVPPRDGHSELATTHAKISDYGIVSDCRIRDNHSAYAAPEDSSIGWRALDSSRPGKEHILVDSAASYLSSDADHRKLAIMDKML